MRGGKGGGLGVGQPLSEAVYALWPCRDSRNHVSIHPNDEMCSFVFLPLSRVVIAALALAALHTFFAFYCFVLFTLPLLRQERSHTRERKDVIDLGGRRDCEKEWVRVWPRLTTS